MERGNGARATESGSNGNQGPRAESLKALGLEVVGDKENAGNERKIKFADAPPPFIPTRTTSLPTNQSEKVVQPVAQVPADSIHGGDTRSIYPKTLAGRATQYSDDNYSSTRSLYDSQCVYEYIHDRRYSPNYFMPNDEPEQTRLTIIHNVFYFLLNKQLTTVPLHNPTKVLDIGTGTGDWAINVAEDFPDCEVIGTDIADIQPSAVPYNVFFEIFDAEDDAGWTYLPDSFDLVHFRNMKGTFDRWDEIYRRAFEVTKPGGYIELVEFGQQLGFESYFKQDSAIHAWFEALRETAQIRAGKKGGYDFSFLSQAALEAAGYTDVKTTEMTIPLGNWAEEENMRRTSKLWLASCLAGLEALSLRPLTTMKGWTADQVRSVCGSIGKEFLKIAKNKEKAKGFGITVNILTGRKPGGAEVQFDEKAGMMGYDTPVNERREAQALRAEAVAEDHLSTFEHKHF